MKWWWLLAGAIAVAGCQPVATAPARHGVRAAASGRPTFSTSATAIPPFRSVCAGFDHFYGVMTSQPPSQDVGRLTELAQAVDRAPGSVRMHRLTAALVGYVTAPSFAHEGNVAGKPVQDLSDACF